jgi:hypothetical protein
MIEIDPMKIAIEKLFGLNTGLNDIAQPCF